MFRLHCRSVCQLRSVTSGASRHSQGSLNGSALLHRAARGGAARARCAERRCWRRCWRRTKPPRRPSPAPSRPFWCAARAELFPPYTLTQPHAVGARGCRGVHPPRLSAPAGAPPAPKPISSVSVLIYRRCLAYVLHPPCLGGGLVTAVVAHVLLRRGIPMPLAVRRIWDNMWHTTRNHHCAAGSACAGDGRPAAVHSEQGSGPVRALPRALPQGALMKRYFGSFVYPALHRLPEPSKLIRSTCRPSGIAMPCYHAPVLATS